MLSPRSALLTLTLLLPHAAAQQATPPIPVSTPAGPAPVSTPPAAPTAAPLDGLLLTLRGSPGWRSADLTYRAAQLQLDSARARAGLSLTAGASGAVTKVPWDSGDWLASGTVTLTASLPVLPWSPQRELLRSAERGVQAAALELRSARGTLTLQLLQAYAAVRGAAQALALADAQLALAVQSEQVARSQRAQGLLPEAALLSQVATLEGARAGRDQAARALTQAGQTLTRLLGQDMPVATLDLTRPLPDLTPGGDEAALVARALTQRPEVRRAQATLADAQAQRDAAALDARLPDLSASVSAGQLTSAQGSAGRTVSGTLNVKTGTLGAQVSLPLRQPAQPVSGVNLSLTASLPILGRTTDTALAQAQVGAAQAQLALDSARQATELDVRTRLAAAQDERGALTAAQTRVQAAELNVQAARARLDAGLATRLDVQQAELNLLQAQQALDAQRDRVAVAGAALAQATADLDPLLLTLPTPLPTSLPTGGRP